MVHGFENPGKVEGVFEPERGGHGFHRGVPFQQDPRGVLHPQAR